MSAIDTSTAPAPQIARAANNHGRSGGTEPLVVPQFHFTQVHRQLHKHWHQQRHAAPTALTVSDKSLDVRHRIGQAIDVPITAAYVFRLHRRQIDRHDIHIRIHQLLNFWAPPRKANRFLHGSQESPPSEPRRQTPGIADAAADHPCRQASAECRRNLASSAKSCWVIAESS